MPTHAHAAPAGFLPLTLMWFGMMAAMMTPTVWPWVRSIHRFSEHESRVRATARFVAGYAIAWLGYAIAAALVQRTLDLRGLLHDGSLPAGLLASAVFALAGLYQFTPLKRACLSHCRTPLTYLLTRWSNGPLGTFQIGVQHGVFCVGCCWALMATSFAVGVMNMSWMAALAIVTVVEQAAPSGYRLRRPLGAALIVAAVWQLGS